MLDCRDQKIYPRRGDLRFSWMKCQECTVEGVEFDPHARCLYDCNAKFCLEKRHVEFKDLTSISLAYSCHYLSV